MKSLLIFLFNRANNTCSNNLLSQLSIQGKIQNAIYDVIKKEAVAEQAAMAKGLSLLSWATGNFFKTPCSTCFLLYSIA